MNQKGIALIMAVGVLALLAIIATSFALNMRLEYHAAMNYYHGVKARYFAEAVLARAVAGLRADAKTRAFDWTTSYNNDGTSGSPDIGAHIASSGTSIATPILTEQSKININTANTLLLSNLVSRVFPGWNAGAVNAFVGKITGHIPCNNLNELMMDVPSGSNNHIEKTDLSTLRPFITVNSYRDPNCGNRAPININTCSQEALASVFEGLTAALNSNRATNIANAIISARLITPITSWSSFDSTVDAATIAGIPPGQRAAVRAAIKDNCNPNRTKPASSTTEFCFNSGGYYTVTATGSVTGTLGAAIASNTLSAVVKIYGIYCETKVKDDITGNPTQFALGKPERVTWLDSCPIRSDQIFGRYDIPADAEKIKDSVKLGFWDDFNSDAQGGDRNYSKKHWGGMWGGDPEVFYDQDGDRDDELITIGGVRTDLYGTNAYSEWTWSDFSMRVYANEYDRSSATSMKHAAWIFFRKPSGDIPYAGHPGVFHSSGGTLFLEDPWCFAYINLWSFPQQIVFLSAQEALDRSPQYGKFVDLPAAQAGRYNYPAQIRIMTAYLQGSVPPPNPIPPPTFPGGPSGWPCEENMDSTSIYKSDLAASNAKTFLLATRQLTPPDSKDITLDVWTDPRTNKVLNRKIVDFDVTQRDGKKNPIKMSYSGRMVLYGWNVNVAWDDIRIISPDGNFTSQPISPGIAGNVGWGTITGTVTIPSSASADSEKVTFQTKSNADGVTWKDANPAADGAMGSIAGSSIQYKALLTTASPQIKETPVLEDVTITYLPKVSIKSFSLSN